MNADSDGDGGSDQRCGEKKKIVNLLDGGGWYPLRARLVVMSNVEVEAYIIYLCAFVQPQSHQIIQVPTHVEFTPIAPIRLNCHHYASTDTTAVSHINGYHRHLRVNVYHPLFACQWTQPM